MEKQFRIKLNFGKAKVRVYLSFSVGGLNPPTRKNNEKERCNMNELIHITSYAGVHVFWYRTMRCFMLIKKQEAFGSEYNAYAFYDSSFSPVSGVDFVTKRVRDILSVEALEWYKERGRML